VRRSAIFRHAPKRQPGDDVLYLIWLRSQTCIVCASGRYVEAAHVGPRGLGQKCPDRQAVPLCREHHRTGKTAHHVLGKAFWQYHGLSREEVIADLVRRYFSEVRTAR
jgi:hypothetical protein